MRNNVHGDCGNVDCHPTYGGWFVNGALGTNTAAGQRLRHGPRSPVYRSPRTCSKRDATNGYWYFQSRRDGGHWKAMSF
ncbi:hypothetical protein GCM10009830_23990 [Glycomyces endophyticus]|uniref:Uncharacterized protein n=1 Tax=Glycomyces endophyticus TaxID=480996 RepID=A0ABP4SRF2_9ACTN